MRPHNILILTPPKPPPIDKSKNIWQYISSHLKIKYRLKKRRFKMIMDEKYNYFLKQIAEAFKKKIPAIMFRDTPFLRKISEAIEKELESDNIIIIPWRDEEVPDDFFKNVANLIKKERGILESNKLLFIDWTTRNKLNPEFEKIKGGEVKCLRCYCRNIVSTTIKKGKRLEVFKKTMDSLVEGIKKMGVKKLLIYLPQICDHEIYYGDGDDDYYSTDVTSAEEYPTKHFDEVIEIFTKILRRKIEFQFIKTKEEIPESPKKELALFLDRHAYGAHGFNNGLLGNPGPDYLKKFGAVIIKHEGSIMGILPLEAFEEGGDEIEIKNPNNRIYIRGIEEEIAKRFVKMISGE